MNYDFMRHSRSVENLASNSRSPFSESVLRHGVVQALPPCPPAPLPPPCLSAAIKHLPCRSDKNENWKTGARCVDVASPLPVDAGFRGYLMVPTSGLGGVCGHLCLGGYEIVHATAADRNRVCTRDSTTGLTVRESSVK